MIPWYFDLVRLIHTISFFYVLFFRISAMTMKMIKQRRRTQMICTNRWLETQTIYLISLVIFVKITFCISKENCIFVQICSFICIFRLWSFRKSWSMQKCYKIIYNMSIFDEVDFSSFGACAVMKKRLKPSFLTWETWGIFCGGSKQGKLCAKYQLC